MTRGTEIFNAENGNAGIRAGVIGLGLMGKSIVACLLSSGHPVLAP
jgi:hypothetical protein